MTEISSGPRLAFSTVLSSPFRQDTELSCCLSIGLENEITNSTLVLFIASNLWQVANPYA